ncbi:MAG: hypothetical protein JW803_00715 [Endomicrobiales bacterium]|nr:hypothetical protein [Endomicrobiales bacterium]
MNLRKSLLVDKKFQYSIIVGNVILLAVMFFTILIAVLVWEKYQVKQGFLLRPPPNSEVIAWAQSNNVKENSVEFLTQFIKMAKVYTFFDLIWKPMLIVFLINIVILVTANLYYTNKIAGPIYRLKTLLEKKLAGDEVEPIKFRKGDAFHELALLINKVLFKEQDK